MIPDHLTGRVNHDGYWHASEVVWRLMLKGRSARYALDNAAGEVALLVHGRMIQFWSELFIQLVFSGERDRGRCN